MDPLAIGKAFSDLNAAWMRDTDSLSAHCRSFNRAMQTAGEAVAEQIRRTAGQVPDEGNDHSIASIINWLNILAWSSRHYHQVVTKWLTDYVRLAPELDADTRQRALFWMHQILKMMAPANFFWFNPRAVQRFVNSKSKSLLQGVQNWISDLQHGGDLPQLADRGAFKVGENLALTPGQVIYRNSLMELIQYAPQTKTTWQTPIVLIQPWINKYYIFDLTPQNSFILYLVRQGFTVFVTSWKNPTGEMGHTTFEDYMLEGALRAVTVACDITASHAVHAAGYCIGGTLLATLMGWLARKGGHLPIADATFFATLLDFSAPGDLKAFVNPTSLGTVAQMVAAEGVLNGRYLALAFRLLNPGDLIWRSMINNYYYGDTSPRSDMLFWNSDSTHLPGAMCLFYLTSFYLENRLARPNQLVVANRPIDLKQIKSPVYAVGALKDHICPWPATFQTCRLTSGKVRYVLANEGHITGIVNPPSPWSKKKYWAGAATRRRDAERWLKDKVPVEDSWWPDWIAWLKPRNGSRSAPPAMGSDRYKPLAPAPGSYVFD